MDQKIHSILLQDGSILWAGTHKKSGESGIDTHSYHSFKVYGSVESDTPVGTLGYFLTGSTASQWGYDNLDDNLVKAMSLVLPFISLPINKSDIDGRNDGYYIGLKLVSFDVEELNYDEENRIINLSGLTSPLDFIKNYIFNGEVTDEKVKELILHYANMGRLINDMDNGSFMSLNLSEVLMLPRPQVSRCYSELVDDGYIEKLGQPNQLGYTPFSKLTSFGRGKVSELPKKPESIAEEETTTTLEKVDFVNPELIQSIEDQNNAKFFTLKLVAILQELNSCHAANEVYASHALVRAILDHIPPIFDLRKFSEVADQYAWGRTNQSHINQLKNFRASADEALHSHITKKDTLLEMQGLPNHRAINVLLTEIVKKIED